MKNNWLTNPMHFSLALMAGCLFAMSSAGDVAAQDAAELPQPGADLELDSPSDVPFDQGLAHDSWANPAVDSYGGCTSCGNYSYGGCDSGCGGCGLLSGLMSHVQRSDRCFSGFISPITNPVFFEDPRTLTEARAIFVNHDLPDNLGGGDVQVYALQLRAALTDRLSVIAIKDGFIVGQPNAPFDDGWADIGIGFKYLLWADCCRQQLLSGGVTFELPTGTRRAGQGNGDGEFNIFLSGASRLWGAVNWMVASGVRIPSNHNQESQSFYLSNHFSRRLGCSSFYFVSETNWYHWLRSGNQTALAGIEGLDLYNFGSTGVAGNNIVTGAWGVRFKPGNSTEIGLAYEVPLTTREDIIKDRLTFDWIFRY